MGGIKLNVHIEKAVGIGGNNYNIVRPFVVVCFDDNIDEEIYKTSIKGVSKGQTIMWDESFVLDLTTEMKNTIANGRPEPTYLTFNLFDGAVENYPTLGSAGVSLAEISEMGFAQDNYPIINGSGSLSVTVGDAPRKGWVNNPTAKKAGIATAVGVGALALGLTARHYHNKKKNNAGNQGGPAPSGP